MSIRHPETTHSRLAQRLMRRGPLADHVCHRLSEDDNQFHQVSRLHMGAQEPRGSNRVIQHHCQGARSAASSGHQHKMPRPACCGPLGTTIADRVSKPAELRRRSQASLGPSQGRANRRLDSSSARCQGFTCPGLGDHAPGYVHRPSLRNVNRASRTVINHGEWHGSFPGSPSLARHAGDQPDQRATAGGPVRTFGRRR